MLWQALLLVLTASALVFYFFYYRPKSMCQTYARTCRQLGYKVYVEKFRFVGHSNVHRYKADRLRYGDGSYTETHELAGYDVVIGNILHLPLFFVVSHKLLKHVISADKTDSLQKVVFTLKLFKSLVPQGLLFSEGEPWKRSKKVLSKVFNYDFITQQIPNIVKISNQTLDYYEKLQAQAHPTSRQFRFKVSEVAMRVFSRVVLSSFLGLEASSQCIEGVPVQQAVVGMFKDAAKMMLTDMSQLFFGSNFMKLGLTKNHRDFVAKKNRIRSLIRNQVQKISNEMNQNKKTQTSTIIEGMVAESLKGEDGYQLEKMVDQVMTFIFAGSDTTSNLFTFAVVLLYSHPQALGKAREEVKRVIKSDADITKQNIKQLPFVEAVQHETLRMFAPAPGNLFRKAKYDCFMGDVPIPKGTIIGTMYRPMLNDPDVFVEPRSFQPERWLSSEAHQHTSLVSFAFSGGPRTCIGKHLALLQSKILLAKFLQKQESIEELHERVINPGIVLNIDNSEVKATKFTQS